MRTVKPFFCVSKNWAPLGWLSKPRSCSNATRTRTTASSEDKKRVVPDSFRSRIASGPRFQAFIKGLSETLPADGELTEEHDYLSEDLGMMGFSRRGQCVRNCSVYIKDF